MAPWFLGVAGVEEGVFPDLAPFETSNTNQSDPMDYGSHFLAHPQISGTISVWL